MLGIVETVKGILAFMVRAHAIFVSTPLHTLFLLLCFSPHTPHLNPKQPATQACPLFGKLSDVVGRRTGLFITVLGTTLPITALAITQSMWIYAVAQGLSGVFASTFTITFAYIADLVEKVRGGRWGKGRGLLACSLLSQSVGQGQGIDRLTAPHHQ